MKTFTISQIELVMALMRSSHDDLLPVARVAKRGNAPLKTTVTKADLMEMILLRIGDEEEDRGRFTTESKAVQAEKKKATIEALVKHTRAYKSWFPSLTSPLTTD